MKKRAVLAAWLALLILLVPHQLPAAGKPIRIGVSASLSGQYEAPGTAQLEGMRMWADDLNGRGALLGRKVEIVHYDDESDAHKSFQLYERLITEDKVDLLLGPYSSSLTMTASSVAEKHNFPMVAAGGASDAIWSRGFKNVFGVDAPASAYMYLPLQFASNMGAKRVALIYAFSEFPRQVAEGARKKAEQLGLEVVFDESYPPETTNFVQLIDRMQAAEPEVVLGGTYLDDSIAFVRQAKRAGLSPNLMAFTVGPALPEFGEALGRDAEDIMGVVAWMPGARIPMARDFSFRYYEKFGRNAGVHAAYGYAAGQVLEAAVRRAGTLDRDKLRAELLSLKFQSLLGHYRVSEAGMQEGKSTYVMQWQDGRRRLVLPQRISRKPVSYPLGAGLAR